MEDISIASHSTDFADATVNKQDPEPNLSTDELLLASTLRKPASRDESLRYEDESLIDDTRMVNPDCGYNSSASSTQQTNSDLVGRHLDNDDEAPLNSRVSSRSSISSIPDSVLIHPPSELKPGIDCEVNGHIHHYWDGYNNAGHGRMDTEMPLGSIQTVRQREAAFRKPSSVRAMQMYTEDEDDDEFLTPPKRRGGRMSDISIRSAGSSPLKKSPYYSPSGSASRQRVKKEYPLVLLHCNLLPPSLPVTGLVGYPDQKILRAVLPPEYWRRWKLLVEKVGSGVLRDRGVLITHPEDMYDLLEERLLESLELQRPRFDHGHFLGHEETDSEKEDYSATEDSATDDEQGEECPDCGKRLVRRDVRRKWEIKVFAANGLMRAGAWAVAWREMEKVDVEVGLWLPSEIRRELEKRLLDDDLPRNDLRLQVPQLNESTSDAITDLQNHSSRASTPTPLIDESMLVPEKASQPLSPVPAIATSAKAVPTRISTYSQKSVDDIDLQTLLINYIRVLASDRRNVTIAILSVLVAYLAAGIKTRTVPSDLRPFPQDMFEVPVDSSTVSLAQHSTASWIKQPSSTVVAETSQESATAVKTSAFQQPSVGEVFSSMTLLTVTSVPSQTASNPEDSKPSLTEMELPRTQPNPVHDVIEQSDFSNSTTESREDQMKPTAAMGLVAETCEMVPTSQELIMSIE